jgi:hypothetical protein
MVGAMTFFISPELAGLNQFPGTERSTKSLRRKFFAISWAEFAYTLLLEAILSGFVNASVDQAFSLEVNTCK